MSLQQGPQSSAKGKEVAEAANIVMVVYSKTNERFELTAKDIENFKKLDSRIMEDPSFKEVAAQRLSKKNKDAYNAYWHHLANQCKSEAKQHGENARRLTEEAKQHAINAEKARQVTEENLRIAEKAEATAKKYEALRIAEQEKTAEHERKAIAAKQEADALKSELLEEIYKLNDYEKTLVFASKENVNAVSKEALAQRNAPSSTKAVGSQKHTPPRHGLLGLFRK